MKLSFVVVLVPIARHFVEECWFGAESGNVFIEP
jgi:hypothetical protein